MEFKGAVHIEQSTSCSLPSSFLLQKNEHFLFLFSFLFLQTPNCKHVISLRKKNHDRLVIYTVNQVGVGQWHFIMKIIHKF